MSDTTATSREDCLFMTQSCEAVERYEEMIQWIKKIVQMDKELNVEERNLFSVAYKNSLTSRRNAWRILAQLETREKDEHCLPKSTSTEAKIFYLKLKGDYYRYKAEYSIADDRDKLAQKALEAYSAASEIAITELDPKNTIRLGLALNFSVFYYEVLGDSAKACEIAKSAYDGAFETLSDQKSENFQDSGAIMQLLRDNLALWNAGNDEEPEN